MIDAYLDRNYVAPTAGQPAAAPAAARAQERPTIGQRTERARSWATTAGRKLRSLAYAATRPVLVAGGLTFITLAGWDLARPAGLLLAGLSCLIFDHLRGDPS